MMAMSKIFCEFIKIFMLVGKKTTRTVDRVADTVFC